MPDYSDIPDGYSVKQQYSDLPAGYSLKEDYSDLPPGYSIKDPGTGPRFQPGTVANTAVQRLLKTDMGTGQIGKTKEPDAFETAYNAPTSVSPTAPMFRTIADAGETVRRYIANRVKRPLSPDITGELGAVGSIFAPASAPVSGALEAAGMPERYARHFGTAAMIAATPPHLEGPTTTERPTGGVGFADELSETPRPVATVSPQEAEAVAPTIVGKPQAAEEVAPSQRVVGQANGMLEPKLAQRIPGQESKRGQLDQQLAGLDRKIALRQRLIEIADNDSRLTPEMKSRFKEENVPAVQTPTPELGGTQGPQRVPSTETTGSGGTAVRGNTTNAVTGQLDAQGGIPTVTQPQPQPRVGPGQNAVDPFLEAMDKTPEGDLPVGLSIKRLTPQDKVAKPLEDFSTKLASKSFWGRSGLATLNQEAPESANALHEAAAAKPAAGFTVTQTRKLMDKQLGNGAWDRFKTAITESQLQGTDRMLDDIASGKLDPATIGYKGMPAEQAQGARSSMRHFMSPEDVTAYFRSEEGDKALAIAKQGIIDPLSDAHIAREGIQLPPEYLGPAGQYWPMSAIRKGQPQAPLGNASKFTAYGNRIDPLNYERQGTAYDYDLSDSRLTQRIGSADRANRYALAADQLKADGLIREATGNPEYEWRGKVYKTTKVGNFEMPPFVRQEAGPVMEDIAQHYMPKTGVGEGLSKVTRLAVSAGPEMAIHGVNVESQISGKTGVLGDNLVEKALSWIPGVKRLVGLVQAIKQQPYGADAELPGMLARKGFWTPRMNEAGTDLQAISKMDLRARMIIYKNMVADNPEVSDVAMRTAMQRLGEYNTQVTGGLVRMMKTTPILQQIAPFVTAGRTMMLNAGESFLTSNKFGATAGTSLVNRANNLATSSLPAALGYWAIAHKGITGTWPWEDPRMRIFQIPIGDPGVDGKQKFVNMGTLFFTGLERGARITGAAGAINTLARGGDPGQALERGATDIVNAQIHPYVGPGARAVFTAVTGKEPQFKSVGTGELWDAVNTKKIPPGLPRFVAKGMASIKQINPGIGAYTREQDIDKQTGEDRGLPKRALDALTSFFRVFSNENIPKTRARLQKEREQTWQPEPEQDQNAGALP